MSVNANIKITANFSAGIFSLVGAVIYAVVAPPKTFAQEIRREQPIVAQFNSLNFEQLYIFKNVC